MAGRMGETSMEIRPLDSGSVVRHEAQLGVLFANAVEGGALIGHILPLYMVVIERYWRDIASSVASGELCPLRRCLTMRSSGQFSAISHLRRMLPIEARSTSCWFTVGTLGREWARRS